MYISKCRTTFSVFQVLFISYICKSITRHFNYFFEIFFIYFTNCLYLLQTVLSVKTTNLHVCVHISSKSFKEAVVNQKLFLAFYKEQLIPGLRLPLKVPSGQIRSAWKWCLWIGLGKDINRYIYVFGFFNFDLEFLTKNSKFFASSY